MGSIGLFTQLACVWEATARKPGNVHRFVDFADTHYLDFLHSAAAIAPVFDRAPQRGVGETVFQAVQATRRLVATNTNLGIILLLAPLAAVADGDDFFTAVARVLRDLTLDDSHQVFQAIRLAAPGGLGQAEAQDVRDEPTLPLRNIMAMAAERDLIARQYANDFREVQDCGLPALLEGLNCFGVLEPAIVFCHLSLLAAHPDSLIARKGGAALATEASRRAAAVLRIGSEHAAQASEHDSLARAACSKFPALDEFDAWLRADGHRRNPGTTADLVTACLFAALRLGKIQCPLQLPWSPG